MAMTTLERFLENHPALNRAGDQEMTRAIWGGIAQEYDALQTELHKITIAAADVNTLSGDELDEVILRWIGIARLQGETDELRIKLLKAFFVRENIPSWATVHSIRKVFRQWFADALINIRENEVETNQLTDGTFESFAAGTKTTTFGNWTPSGTSISVDATGMFEGSRVLHGVGTGAVAFTKAVTAQPYILSGAYKGYCPVKAQRSSDSKYWNFSTRAWQTAATSLLLANGGGEYLIFEQPIIADGAYNVTVTFGPDASARDFRLDIMSFGAKPAYPFVHVLVSTFSQNGGFLNAWPAGSDPISGKVYSNATFFGIDFIGGEGSGTPTTYYQTILDYIKPAGVRALFDFVGRNV